MILHIQSWNKLLGFMIIYLYWQADCLSQAKTENILLLLNQSQVRYFRFKAQRYTHQWQFLKSQVTKMVTLCNKHISETDHSYTKCHVGHQVKIICLNDTIFGHLGKYVIMHRQHVVIANPGRIIRIHILLIKLLDMK